LLVGLVFRIVRIGGKGIRWENKGLTRLGRRLLFLRLVLLVVGLRPRDQRLIERSRDHDITVLGGPLRLLGLVLAVLVLLVGLLLDIVWRTGGQLVTRTEDNLAESQGVYNALVGVDADIPLVREKLAVAGHVEALALERGDRRGRQLDALLIALLEVT